MLDSAIGTRHVKRQQEKFLTALKPAAHTPCQTAPSANQAAECVCVLQEPICHYSDTGTISREAASRTRLQPSSRMHRARWRLGALCAARALRRWHACTPNGSLLADPSLIYQILGGKGLGRRTINHMQPSDSGNQQGVLAATLRHCVEALSPFIGSPANACRELQPPLTVLAPTPAAEARPPSEEEYQGEGHEGGRFEIVDDYGGPHRCIECGVEIPEEEYMGYHVSACAHCAACTAPALCCASPVLHIFWMRQAGRSQLQPAHLVGPNVVVPSVQPHMRRRGQVSTPSLAAHSPGGPCAVPAGLQRALGLRAKADGVHGLGRGHPLLHYQ